MKMAETPISIAMSQGRERIVQDAPPEVMEEFDREWKDIKADFYTQDLMWLSRVYGISSLVIGIHGVSANEPLQLDKLGRRRFGSRSFTH